MLHRVQFFVLCALLRIYAVLSGLIAFGIVDPKGGMAIAYYIIVLPAVFATFMHLYTMLFSDTGVSDGLPSTDACAVITGGMMFITEILIVVVLSIYLSENYKHVNTGWQMSSVVTTYIVSFMTVMSCCFTVG